jgi:hypothetical protein
MRVGSDYLVQRSRNWLAIGGVRMRLLDDVPVHRGSPCSHSSWKKDHPVKVRINGAEVLVKHAHREEILDGRKGTVVPYVVMAKVDESGTLEAPGLVHLTAVQDAWDRASVASKAYRAAMDVEERERLDRERELLDLMERVVGRSIDITITGDTVSLRMNEFRRILEKSAEAAA